MRPNLPSVFISHNHQDKTFVRRLGADLAANGVRPWIDEAEINVGDSLLSKIGSAIDDLHYFAVVLSPAVRRVCLGDSGTGTGFDLSARFASGQGPTHPSGIM